MKNVWKGLTVGAFAGAAVGVLVDGLDAAGRRTGNASARAKSEAKHLVEVAEDKIHDSSNSLRRQP